MRDCISLYRLGACVLAGVYPMPIPVPRIVYNPHIMSSRLLGQASMGACARPIPNYTIIHTYTFCIFQSIKPIKFMINFNLRSILLHPDTELWQADETVWVSKHIGPSKHRAVSPNDGCRGLACVNFPNV